MGCTNPMQVSFKLDDQNVKRLDFTSYKTWKTTSTWCEKGNISLSYADGIQILPCGKCKSCRLAKARMWSLRCLLESRYYASSYFLTLTYAPKSLPFSKEGKRTLVKKHYQDFLKRLRIKIERSNVCHDKDTKIKYFGCGEYGDKRGRPHYHFCMFGLPLSDLVYHSTSKRGDIYYTSKFLEDIWTYGKVIVGAVTMKSAGYVARYTMKKQYNADLKAAFYYGRIEEFQCQSTGLGKKFFNEFYQYFYDLGTIVIDDQHYTIPRYFDKLLEKKDLTLYEKVKYERALHMYEMLRADNELPSSEKQTSYDRLNVKATIQDINAKRLIRIYDNESLQEMTG